MEIVLLDADGHPLAGVGDDEPARRPKRSRPWRNAVVATLVAAVVLLYAAGVITSIGVDRLRAELDHDVRGELAMARVDAAEGKAPAIVPGDGTDGLVVQVIESSGAVVAASPGVDPTMIAVNGPLDGTVAETKIVEVDGRIEPYRVTWTAVPTAPGLAEATVVVVGLPVAPTDHAVDRFRIGMFATVAVIAVATGIFTLIVARRRAARRII